LPKGGEGVKSGGEVTRLGSSTIRASIRNDDMWGDAGGYAGPEIGGDAGGKGGERAANETADDAGVQLASKGEISKKRKIK
jgi:hypothetical protein